MRLKCVNLKWWVVSALVDHFRRGNMFSFGSRIMNGARFTSPSLIWEKYRCMVSIECWNLSAAFLLIEISPQMYKKLANDSSMDNVVGSHWSRFLSTRSVTNALNVGTAINNWFSIVSGLPFRIKNSLLMACERRFVMWPSRNVVVQMLICD